MDHQTLTDLWAMAQQVLPPAYIHKGAEIMGWFALASLAVPKLVAWGVPAATRLADRIAGFVLAFVPRPIVAWALPGAIKFLNDLTSALEQIIETFTKRLEADLTAAQPKDTPPAP